MKLAGWIASLLFPAALLVGGCGKKAPTEISPAEKQAFDSAPAEIKQVWLDGLEAVKTNDYTRAQNLFYSLMDQSLSPAQKDAVNKETTIIMNQLFDGAVKGDPVAVKALQELKQNPPNRQPR